MAVLSDGELQVDRAGDLQAPRDHLRDRALAICKEHPDRVARETAGLTLRRAQEIAAMLRNNEANEKLQLALTDLLGGTKVNRRAANKILEQWGQDAPARIRENPYALINAIDGIGFLTADEVARKIGYDFAGAPRVRAGVVHTLKEQAFGREHTCLPTNVLLSEAGKILGVPLDRMVAGGSATCRAERRQSNSAPSRPIRISASNR